MRMPADGEGTPGRRIDDHGALPPPFYEDEVHASGSMIIAVPGLEHPEDVALHVQKPQLVVRPGSERGHDETAGVGSLRGHEGRVGDEGAPGLGDAPEPAQGVRRHPD